MAHGVTVDPRALRPGFLREPVRNTEVDVTCGQVDFFEKAFSLLEVLGDVCVAMVTGGPTVLLARYSLWSWRVRSPVWEALARGLLPPCSDFIRSLG